MFSWGSYSLPFKEHYLLHNWTTVGTSGEDGYGYKILGLHCTKESQKITPLLAGFLVGISLAARL
jgi:hypothetical protein